MPRDVYLSMKAFQEITKFTAQYASNFIYQKKWAESMGYLFCKQDGDRYVIGDAVGISRGGETYVTMTPDDLAKVEKLDADRPDYFLGGWFHTHPGLSPFYSDTDILNQLFYQAQNEDGLGLVFDHSMVSPDFVGFKFFRVTDPMDPNTGYVEVKWKPLDWTETGLREALTSIGVAEAIIAALAFKLGLRPVPPAAELPPLTMPKTKDAAQANNLITNIENSSQAAFDKGDAIQALIAKRVQIALLRNFGDAEARGDAIIEFVDWALSKKKIMSAAEILDELDVLIDEAAFPEDLVNYYTAKAAYLRGFIYQNHFNYANAIESYEKCLAPYEAEEEYDEECAKASLHIAECYEAQSELDLANQWGKKSQQYIDKGIATLKEEMEDEEDEEELAHLQKFKGIIARYQIRVKAKIATTKSGPTRIS